MERLSFEFTRALAARAPTRIIANRRGRVALPAFLPWAALRLRELAPTHDALHLGDLLLTALLPLLPPRCPPVAVTAHGLDLKYPHPLYQSLLHRFLPRADLVLCISRFVEREVRGRFPSLRTAVLTPGIDPDRFTGEGTREGLAHALGRPLSEGPLLLAVARLVPRKGLAWFVAEVLPALPDATLLIFGTGPERAAITAAAARAGTSHRVIFGGAASLPLLRAAYHSADLLIMPNVAVPGDAEGFGLVALEAASAGLPVVASDLEGIPDSVLPGRTGVLVPPHDARAWSDAVTRLLRDPDTRQALHRSAPKTVRREFSWDSRARRLLDELFPVLAPARVSP